MISTIRFTKEGYQKIQNEYQQLVVDRKDAVDALRSAREMGDLSENAAYKVARQRLSQTDSRIRHLKKLLVLGRITEAEFKGVVSFGTKVTVEMPNRTNSTYIIVEGYETDPACGKLSTSSPIGRALMGKKPGDRIEVKVPSGTISLRILKVEPLSQ